MSVSEITMLERRALREMLAKFLRVLGVVAACFVALALAAMACISTLTLYYDDIEPGEGLAAVVERSPYLTPRDIGVEAAVARMPPEWLPERHGTVGGIMANRGVELFFIHPRFNITVLLDGRDRVLIKHPTWE